MRGATPIRVSDVDILPFQSTLPMRGATFMLSNLTHKKEFQSTLPMRGATARRANWSRCVLISIHTPHAGSDSINLYLVSAPYEFQSTLPMRGATLIGCCCIVRHVISIHTPHAGSDVMVLDAQFSRGPNFNPHSPCGERRQGGLDIARKQQYFNPHSPCGERLDGRQSFIAFVLFQSTLPMRGAT